MTISKYERGYQRSEDAQAVAGPDDIVCDDGPYVSPRFYIKLAPKVGMAVSKGFNGDCYPEGEIIKVSKSLRRVETSTGVVFWRVGESTSWRADHCWFMVYGHHYTQNPSF